MIIPKRWHISNNVHTKENTCLGKLCYAPLCHSERSEESHWSFWDSSLCSELTVKKVSSELTVKKTDRLILQITNRVLKQPQFW